MIRVTGLGVEYGDDKALDGLDLTIPRGTTCAVIGPSGCGKTTLLYALAGLISPKRGSIEIDGRRLQGIRPETGIILQQGGLLPWKTVRDNICLGLKARGIPKQDAVARVDSIIKELDIIEHQHKFPSQLSGGQKQRAAIARTLVTNPDLLLLDEASSSLDAITKEHLQELILKIFKKHRMTLVLVTHSIEEAVYLGQRIVVMDKSCVRHIIDNPYFGDEEIRQKAHYYNICLEVRQWLPGGVPC